MMTPIGVLVLGVLAFVAKKAIELALENEYASWAPALARLWMRCAGLVCRSHRDDWWADLLYLQRVEGVSGLMQAGSCLVSAPFLVAWEGAGATWASLATLLGVLLALTRPRSTSIDPLTALVAGRGSVSIDELNLSGSAARALRAHGVTTVGQLLSMREDELLRVRNFARDALDEVKEKIVLGGFIQPS